MLEKRNHGLTTSRWHGLFVDSRADILVPLPENVLSVSVERRVWNGVVVEVAEQHCSGRVVHALGYEKRNRLCIVLAETGGSRSEPRLRADRPCTAGDYSPTQLNLSHMRRP